MAGIFDSVTGFIGDEYTAAKGFVGKEYNQASAYGSKQYNDLKAKVQNWAREVVKLMNLKVPPQMQGEKDSLLSRAKIIKAAAEKIFGKLDNLNQLGFIPIVAGVTLAAIAGASALITYWITDAKALSQRVDVYNAAMAKGATPTQASAVADSVMKSSGGIMSSVNDVTATLRQYAPLIGIAVIAYVFRKQIFKLGGK